MTPVSIPIYCPTPLAMYSLPIPICILIPVPIPMPVFIPTTKKGAASILKQIKEIREKIPADPLEDELLMMAEAVAGKDMESSSDTDIDESECPTDAPEIKVVNETTVVSAAPEDLGEDMLQMALRMASEMSDEPVMDLETSLEPVAVNTDYHEVQNATVTSQCAIASSTTSTAVNSYVSISDCVPATPASKNAIVSCNTPLSLFIFISNCFI